MRFQLLETAASDASSLSAKVPPDPSSLRQARQSPYARQLADAHDKFNDRSLCLGTWRLIEPSADEKPVPHLWVYHYKTDSDGALDGFSARCTARGDLMRPGVHFYHIHTAAQSQSHTSRRILYAWAAFADEAILSVDVLGAYPRDPADPAYRVPMRQPRRFNGSYSVPAKAQMDSPDRDTSGSVSEIDIYRHGLEALAC